MNDPKIDRPQPDRRDGPGSPSSTSPASPTTTASGRAVTAIATTSRQRPLRELLRPLHPSLKRVKWLLVGTIIAGWGKFFLPLVVPWATGRIIDRVLDGNAGLNPTQQNHELWWIAGVLLVAMLGIGAASYFRHTLVVRTIAVVQHDLRRRLFHHIQRLSMAFFQRHQSGALGARVASDINYAGSLFDRGIVQYAMDIVFFVGASAILLALNWQLTLVAYGVLAINGWAIWRYVPRIRVQQKAVQESQSSITGKAAEIFAGITMVKAHAGERESGQEFMERSALMRDLQVGNAHFQGVFQGMSFALLAASTAVVLWVGAWLIINQPGDPARGIPPALTKGDLVAFLLYLGSINGTIQRMIEGIVALQDGMAALDRIADMLEVLPSPPEHPEPIEPPISGQIAFADVTFGYGEKPVLRNFSHTFAAGRTYALVGTSGSGKSTLCQLMLRFYDPGAGSILVDGHDLKRIRQQWYRSHVAVVLQDPVMFSTSVRDNIDFATENATQAQVEAAARAAQAHDFILALPQGYNTRLGERGVNLSGGQRQRIAIARALMRDPRLLILDEATAALDTVTERAIQDVIDRLRSTRTVVIIAHRLSTIRNVDEILVMDHGRLVEHGSYVDLMAKDGHFAKLAANQLAKDEE